MGYNNQTNAWATQKMFDDGNTWTSIIPKCLAPGEYLVRHEIIALSDAYKTGGCQFYVRIPDGCGNSAGVHVILIPRYEIQPSCAQVTVVGKGTVNPTGYALPGIYCIPASHPGFGLQVVGFYSPSHPGIMFNTNLAYTYYPMP